MTGIRRRLAATTAAIVVAGLALSGCGGGDSSSGGSSGAGGSAGASGASGAAGDALPDDQQVLTFVPNYGIQALDMSKSPLEIGMNQVMVNVMQPLVRFDGKKLNPVLATSWKWTTPTSLEFKLRDGVTFSDGKAFTAADVVGTLDRYIAQKAALAAAFNVIKDYKATDDHTVVINTKAPTGTLVSVLSMVYIGGGDHAKDDAWWSKPLGTGPFTISDYVANNHITLARNDKYWGDKAKLKTLNIKIVTDINSKITGLANNEIQVVNDVPNDQIPSVQSMSNVSFDQVDSLNYWFLWFENEHKPLDNVKVRKAMWEALDLPTITKSLYGDTVSPMTSFCPSAAFGCLPADGLPKYDPADAKKLLAEAGYPNGFKTDVIFSTGTSDTTTLVQAMVSAWKEIGVTVTPRAEDPATWLADFTALKWDMDLQANQTITGDADYTLNRLYSCAAARLGYCNKDLDAVLTKAQQSADQDERSKLYQQAVNIMAKDLPAIPLFEVKANVAKRSNVQGLTVPLTEFIDFSTVYLSK